MPYTEVESESCELRIQADSIIHSFELQLIKLRKEIEVEAEAEMLGICENILEKRRAELRGRYRQMNDSTCKQRDPFTSISDKSSCQ